jgi:hypothetical protein
MFDPQGLNSNPSCSTEFRPPGAFGRQKAVPLSGYCMTSTSASKTADLMFEFAQYKKNAKNRVKICRLSLSCYRCILFHQLHAREDLATIATSEMNLQHTDTRNRLVVQTVGNELMLSIGRRLNSGLSENT